MGPAQELLFPARGTKHERRGATWPLRYQAFPHRPRQTAGSIRSLTRTGDESRPLPRLPNPCRHKRCSRGHSTSNRQVGGKGEYIPFTNFEEIVDVVLDPLAQASRCISQIEPP